MDIQLLITEHTTKLHALAYERSVLEDRCEQITTEITGLTGVINALKYVGENENGDNSGAVSAEIV